MSDFFSGVYGARFPDVVINGGGNPLPGMGGLPAPLHDTADAKINYNNSLLGDLSPYAYGEPGYQSSQTAYLNIPHKIQKIVPALYLPDVDKVDSFRLNHPIDDGDLVFAMRLDRNSEVCTGLNNKTLNRAGLGTAIDPMINLCTLNYILAGVQICTQHPQLRVKWDQLLHYLDYRRFPGHQPVNNRQYNLEDIKHIVRHLIRPFGIAHGSEKQGGQHEGSMSPVTWPVSLVISLTLDGKEANMVNIWHKHNVEAGSDLVLRLRPMPLPKSRKYTLNHYPKGLVERTFSENLLSQVAQITGTPPITHVWQVVPDIFSLDMDEAIAPGVTIAPGFAPHNPNFCWQQEGYWHIARAQIHCKKYGEDEFYNNDLANNLRTGHMDVTFQPIFYSIPFRDHAAQGGPAVRHPPPAAAPAPARNVFNLIGEQASKRPLRIEQSFTPQAEAHAVPKRSKYAAGARMIVSSDAMHPVSSMETMETEEHQSLQIISEAGPGSVSGLTEDIGMFETQPVPSTSFQAPKPGLKSNKRAQARGKGVMGAVLAADGTVTHEPSRIL
jgi:hypothetical protein